MLLLLFSFTPELLEVFSDDHADSMLIGEGHLFRGIGVRSLAGVHVGGHAEIGGHVIVLGLAPGVRVAVFLYLGFGLDGEGERCGHKCRGARWHSGGTHLLTQQGDVLDVLQLGWISKESIKKGKH